MSTVLDRLIESLRSLAGTNGESVPPEVIIWPDKDSHWVDVIPQIAERHETLILGEYDPENDRGPGYWIRFKLGLRYGNADDAPILYLPGVSQDDLKASDDCPDELRAIVELQHRGVVWKQTNGKDWTPAAFLMNRERGIGVQMSPSSAAVEALALTLQHVLNQPVAWLQAKQPVTKELLHGLVQSDTVRNILDWISDPELAMDRMDAPEQVAFIDSCKNDFSLDLDDGPIHAAALLAGRRGRWKQVWSRYREAPRNYPGVRERLQAAGAASGQMRIDVETGRPEDADVWPQFNEAAEAALRIALEGLTDMTPAAARDRVMELEGEHGHRRMWVWAQLDESPLAGTIEHLAALAAATRVVPAGSLGDLSAWYVSGGYQADDASMRALSSVEAVQDVALIRETVRHIYFDWLDELSSRFQDGYADDPSSYASPEARGRSDGTVLIFSDGLRFDLGVRLAELVRGAGLQADLGWHYAALPTVTFTAKPALTPVANEFGPGQDLSPVVLTTGTEVRNPNLNKALEDAGYQILDDFEVGNPQGRAWSEEANIDGLGHDRKADLAAAVEAELRQLVSRIEMLVNSGWKRVEVVTDHGFLHVPGGLPKVELKHHLVANRKGRCARLSESGQSGGHPTVTWRWDDSVRFAVSRGAGCFEEGKEYEHGGLSLQECVVPHLVISRDDAPGEVTVTRLSWVGLRVRIEVEGPGELVDVRTKPADPRTSLIGEPFALREGAGAAIVPEPDAEGLSAVAVVLDSEGRLLAQRPTVVGEE